MKVISVLLSILIIINTCPLSGQVLKGKGTISEEISNSLNSNKFYKNYVEPYKKVQEVPLDEVIQEAEKSFPDVWTLYKATQNQTTITSNPYYKLSPKQLYDFSNNLKKDIVILLKSTSQYRQARQEKRAITGLKIVALVVATIALGEIFGFALSAMGLNGAASFVALGSFGLPTLTSTLGTKIASGIGISIYMGLDIFAQEGLDALFNDFSKQVEGYVSQFKIGSFKNADQFLSIINTTIPVSDSSDDTLNNSERSSINFFFVRPKPYTLITNGGYSVTLQPRLNMSSLYSFPSHWDTETIVKFDVDKKFFNTKTGNAENTPQDYLNYVDNFDSLKIDWRQVHPEAIRFVTGLLVIKEELNREDRSDDDVTSALFDLSCLLAVNFLPGRDIVKRAVDSQEFFTYTKYPTEEIGTSHRW